MNDTYSSDLGITPNLSLTNLLAQGSAAQTIATLKDVFNAMDDGVALWDEDLKFVLMNERYKELVFPYGYRELQLGDCAIQVGVEVFGSGAYVLPEGIDPAELTAQMQTIIRTYGINLELQRTNGRTLLFASKKTALGGYLLTAKDITDSKRAEGAKAREMEAVNDAVEALSEGFALYDADLNFVLCNNKYMETLFPPGFPALQTGEHARDITRRFIETGHLLFPDTLSTDDMVQNLLDWITSFGEKREFQLKGNRTAEIRVYSTRLGGYLITVVDVTTERNAEQKQLEAVTDALNAADYPMALLTNENTLVLANKAYYRMMEPTGLMPNMGQTAQAFIRDAIDCGYYVLPDGMTKEEFQEAIMAFIHDFRKDVPLQTSNGRSYLGSSNSTALGGYLLSFRDITDQARTERELAEQREIAHQNEKLSALGELLAGVAHELNNPLSVVFGYSQMLQDKVKDPVLAERIDLICQSAERAAKIVKTFLAMARQRPAKIELCSINDVVETALEVSSYSLKSNGTRVRTDFSEDALLVSGDFDQLAQVFSNLIVNAGHAVEPLRNAGEILVRSFTNEDEAVVEVRDNGPGIPPDIQSRIFEPFFTTKDVGEGTGVGLAFSHRIVASHDGQLELTSGIGTGTSFFVRLSKAHSHHAATCSRLAMSDRTAVQTALIVDDEEGVVQLIHDLLTEEGIRVTKTTSPREALQFASTRRFDLVLSDFKMPDMDGQAFFEALQVVNPENANVLGFITGDAMSVPVRTFLERSERPYIEKPILKADLMQLVQRTCQLSELNP